MPSREEYVTAEPFLPAKLTLPQLQSVAKGCRGCDLYACATQTVFGEGLATARVLFVGEQPGDQEDLQGKPFVGPSGKMLDSVLEKVGIDRSLVYVTNAVKHFKFEQRGKRRIHAKPTARQVAACRPWLDAEIKVVRPDVVVLLGATAAQAVFGSTFKVTQRRGEVIRDSGLSPRVIATVHPSSLLRAPDAAARREAIAAFTRDLAVVKREMDRPADGAGKKRPHRTASPMAERDSAAVTAPLNRRAVRKVAVARG